MAQGKLTKEELLSQVRFIAKDDINVMERSHEECIKWLADQLPSHDPEFDRLKHTFNTLEIQAHAARIELVKYCRKKFERTER